MTKGLIDDVLDASHDAAALGKVLGPEQIESLVSAAQEPYDEDVSPALGDALAQVVWLLLEQARVGNRAVDPRYERVVLAQLKVLTDRIENSDDASPQSALNTACRALATVPSRSFAFAAETIFMLHGERTAERLSLDEALFPFSGPLPPIVAELRRTLNQRAEAAQWAE